MQVLHAATHKNKRIGMPTALRIKNSPDGKSGRYILLEY